MVFLYFWNIEFVMHWKNIEIRCVFQQKCSLSSMELSKIPLFCFGFLTFLKSWIHKNLRNHWNSIGNTRNAAPSHRWSYSKNLCFIVVFFHFWNHEFMLICKNVVFSLKFQQCCSFMSMELFKKTVNSNRFLILLNSCWPLIFENLNISLDVRKILSGIPGGGKPRLWNSGSPVLSFKVY